jgi:hypothetical protein
LKRETTRPRFKFGSKVPSSLGLIKIQIPVPGPTKLIKLLFEVVDLDIPLMLGLEFLEKHKLNPLSVHNKLWSVDGNWTMPIVRKNGHLYLCWDNTHVVNYSRTKLDRLHRRFFHPSAEKLWNLLNSAYPDAMCSDTLSLLKEISSSCEACLRYSTAPISFQLRMQDEIAFNKELELDLMFLMVKGK